MGQRIHTFEIVFRTTTNVVKEYGTRNSYKTDNNK